MDSRSLLGLCLFYLSQAASGHHSAVPPIDSLLMVALEGDSVTLPCGIPSIQSCSSLNWGKSATFGSTDEVIKKGKVTAASSHRYHLLKDCSLQITHLELNDARLYTCKSGTLNLTVSLQILRITENQHPVNAAKLELHCYLSTYKGTAPCTNHNGLHIEWRTEDDTPINGSRFVIENPHNCFSKLIIDKKLTDHHRTWRCQLSQNGSVKATLRYVTTVKDGLEEVFAAVGESVSLTCGNTSSLGLKWSLCEKQVRGETLNDGVQIKASHVNKDFSLVISKVSVLHAGDYQCSQSTGERGALNKIRLHALDVTAESAGPGENLTLICALTCAKECEKDFELSWTGNAHEGWQSKLMNINNTLIKKLFLPESSKRSYEDITCSVRREGALMASKRWYTADPLQTPAWVGLPLVIPIVAGGVCIHTKRKRNKDGVNDQPSTEMTHVYEVVQDVHNEEQQQQLLLKREAATAADSFYDLLQAVN